MGPDQPASDMRTRNVQRWSEPEEAAEPLLVVDGLEVQFVTRAGLIRAVRGISFDLNEGETLAILGESGSGKSVTALSIMGLVPQPAGQVTAGSIRLDGRELLTLPRGQLRRLRGEEIAIIFQDPLSSLNPVHTVGQQIAEMFRRRRGMSRRDSRAAAVEQMSRVGIPDARNRLDDYPHQFSGGMRQRVMIAIALSLNPRILIADEPTTALDVTVQAQVMELLAGLQEEEGMSLILITHDLGVVADVADRVAVMYAGRVVETGPLQTVYEEPAHPYTVGLMESLPLLDTRIDRLTSIEGSPPDLLQLPSGCPFHPRCRFARDRCRDEDPPLEHIRETSAGGQRSACHFAEEVLEYESKI